MKKGKNSLERLMNAYGVHDWAEIYPKKVCEGCDMQPECMERQTHL